jgi:uncharacterized protein YjbJ (UPF0337 family)
VPKHVLSKVGMCRCRPRPPYATTPTTVSTQAPTVRDLLYPRRGLPHAASFPRSGAGTKLPLTSRYAYPSARIGNPRSEAKGAANTMTSADKIKRLVDQTIEEAEPLVDKVIEKTESLVGEAEETAESLVEKAKEKAEPLIDKAKDTSR